MPPVRFVIQGLQHIATLAVFLFTPKHFFGSVFVYADVSISSTQQFSIYIVKNINFIGSKYPKHALFRFENKITALQFASG